MQCQNGQEVNITLRLNLLQYVIQPEFNETKVSNYILYEPNAVSRKAFSEKGALPCDNQ